MLFTGALVVGITPDAYAGRYCCETLEEAAAALDGWDGVGDPPGHWIKYNGADGEKLGPGCSPEREH